MRLIFLSQSVVRGLQHLLPVVNLQLPRVEKQPQSSFSRNITLRAYRPLFQKVVYQNTFRKRIGLMPGENQWTRCLYTLPFSNIYPQSLTNFTFRSLRHPIVCYASRSCELRSTLFCKTFVNNSKLSLFLRRPQMNRKKMKRGPNPTILSIIVYHTM